MSGEIIREFFVLIGLDVDKADFEGASKAIDRVKSSLLAVTAAAVGVSAVVVAASRDYAQQSEEMDAWAAKIGGSTEELSKLGIAFGGVGLEAEEGFQGITDAAEKASDVVLNIKNLSGDAGESFKALGFKSVAELTDGNGHLVNSLDLFKELVKRLNGMKNAGERTGVAMRIFGDDVGQRLIPFIARYGDDLDAVIESSARFGAIVGKEDVKAAREFRAAYGGVAASIRGIGFIIGREALPVASKYLTKLSGWIIANREIIKQKLESAIKKTADATSFGSKKLGQYLELLNWVIEKVGGLSSALLIAAGIFGGIFVAQLGAAVVAISSVGTAIGITKAALIAGAGKAGLFGLTLLAVGLVIEDLITFARDGDSVIGGLLAHFDPSGFNPNEWGPVKAVRLFIAYVGTLPASLAAISDLLFGDKEEKKIAEAFLAEKGGQILKIQSSLAKDIAGAVTLNKDGYVAQGIEGLLSGGTGDFYARLVNGTSQGVRDLQSFNPSNTDFARGVNSRLQSVEAGFLGRPQLSSSTSSSKEFHIPITISGGDASKEEIAAEVVSQITTALVDEEP